jgi:hypothetical protein
MCLYGVDSDNFTFYCINELLVYLGFWMSPRYITIYYDILRYITIYYDILRYITIYYDILRYITIYYDILRYITTSLHFFFHWPTLHYFRGFHVAPELMLFVGQWHCEYLCYFWRFGEPHCRRLQRGSSCSVVLINTNLIKSKAEVAAQ